MKKANRLAFIVFVLLSSTGFSLAQDVRIKRVCPHVITLSMSNLGHTNITVVESEKGLVCIETEMTPYIMSKIKAAAEKKLGRNDWAYVINTHNHIHHAGGNASFKGVPIIGPASMTMDWLTNRLSTEAGRRRYCKGFTETIAQLRQTLNESPISPLKKRQLQRRLEFCQAVEQEIMAGFEVINPTLTIEDHETLDLNDVHLELTYWGDSINHSSIFVRVVEDRLLVSSAMSKAWMPDFYRHLTLEGLKRGISLYQELSDEDFPIDRVIDVHSPEVITGKQVFQKRYLYLQTLLNDLTEAQQQGMTLEQAKQTFTLSTHYASSATRFTKPDDLEAAHQKNIDKFWSLLQKADGGGTK